MNRAGLSVVGSGLLAGVVAAVLAALALLGAPALGVGVFAVQTVIALAWLAAIDAKGSVGAFAIVVAAAAAADIAVGLTGNADIGQAAPVVGIALVVSLLHQLARRPRRGVTLSLAGTMSGVAFAICAVAYPALLAEGGGDEADAAALFGAAVALALARVVDLVIARPAAFPGSRRGIIGIVLGLLAAVGVGAAYGAGTTSFGPATGVRIAAIAAVLALIADVAVDAVLTQAPPRDERRLSALTPLGVLLPVVLVGPVAYVSGRILLG